MYHFNKNTWKFFDLSWRIFARNIRAAHRKSILGMVWLILPPLVNAAVWVLLNHNGIIQFESNSAVSYAAFALTGILIWQVFIDALQIPFTVIQTFETIIKSLYFKREALLGAAGLEILFNGSIRVALIFLSFLIFKISISWSAVLFIFPLGVLLLLGFSINLWLLPFFLLYRDVSRLLGFATQFLFFLTPIIYALPDDNSWFARLAYFNPVAPPLLACRDLLLEGSTRHWPAVGVVFVFSGLLFLLGLRLYRITCERIIERI